MIQLKRSDLENLSPQELSSIYQKLFEINEANQYRSLERYQETAHRKQIIFHKEERRIRLLFGGNRSGKTTCGTVEDLWFALGTHPYRKVRTPSKGLLVVTDFENAAKKINEPKLRMWAPRGAIISIDRNQTGAMRQVVFSSGTVMDVLSHDQELKVFEGGDWDWVHFDEPPTQKIFNAVWRGLTDRGGSAWVTATPITGPWLYQKAKQAEGGKDPLICAMFMDIEENALNLGEGDIKLGRQRIKEFLALLPDDEREARKTGSFLQMQGLIFKDWRRDHHLVKPFSWPSHWPIIESIDPHPAKPWGISWTGIAGNKAKILIRSGYFPGVIDEVAAQIIHERSQIDIQHDRPLILKRCLIDNYASAPLMTRSHTDPTARRRSIREELEALIGPPHGPRVEVAPKNVKQKIDLFKSLLHIKSVDNRQESEFYVMDTPENSGFINEIENYVWDTRRGGILNGLKDQPLKQDDDIIDSVMQMVLTLPKDMESHEPIRTGIGNSYTGR